MLYTFQFRNLNEELYTIEIQTGNATNPYTGNARLGDPPCTIKSDSTGLYAPIKSRSCEINLVVFDYIFDLYSKTPRHTKVTVKDKNSNTIFFGYLTPAVYNQSYTYLDTLSLEAVDAVSILKDIPFERANMTVQLNFKDLFCSLLDIAGYSGNLYVPNTYNMLDGSSVSNVIEQLFIPGGNFFGDDEQRLPLSDYDVLTEVLKYMGWSLCPDGDDVWLIDYRSTSQGSVTYKPYNIGTAVGGTAVAKNDTITINTSNEAGGEPQLSMDDTYNKITVSANLFEIDELAPDLDSDTIHESVTETIEQNTGDTALGTSQWFKQRRKSFLWWKWNSGDPVKIPGIDYQTFCTFNPASGFTHTFYHTYNPTLENVNTTTNWEGCNWYETNLGSEYCGNSVNKYINTVGCLMQHHATVPENSGGVLPTSVSWDDMLTFFILNDRAVGHSSSLSVSDIRSFEVPVLEYNIDEQLNYLPRTGTNWFVISGDLWMQYSAQVTMDNKTFQLNLFNNDPASPNKEYVTCPVEKPEGVDGDIPYYNVFRLPGTEGYNTGWKMWKMRLKVGDCWWSDDYGWTTQAYWDAHKSSTERAANPYPYFYISYNNDPDGEEAETMPAFEWLKTCSTVDYKDKVGEDGYCIHIAHDEVVSKQSGENPSFIGALKLTIFTPCILPAGISFNTLNTVDWKQVAPVIFIKDFAFNYIYTNEQVWYKQHAKSYKDDYIYTGYIDANITKNFSDLKLKVNTALPESPISRSFVCKSDGYISTLRHDTYSSGTGQIQEKNLLDQYLDHYKEPVPIYECNLHGTVHPWYKYQYSFLNLYNPFLLDCYEQDLKYCNNRLKLISFQKNGNQ